MHVDQVISPPAVISFSNEMEAVQLMNQFLTHLTTKPSTEIQPTPFTGTATDILAWLENFDGIAAHNVWNDQNSYKSYLSI